MSFDEEDEKRYLGYVSSKGPAADQSDSGFFGYNGKNGQKAKVQRGGSGKGKQEMDDDDDGDDAPVARVQQNKSSQKNQMQKKRVTLLIDDDDDDDEPSARKRRNYPGSGGGGGGGGADVDPTAAKLFKDMQINLPVQRGHGLNASKIPLRAKLAAEELLDQVANKSITLEKKTKLEIEALTYHMDEYTIVDPVVSLSASVETGTCRIHLKEVVPISRYIMARVLGASYFVQVTPKAKTPATMYDEVLVQPYKGSQSAEKSQPFGIEAAVDAKLDDLEDMAPEEFARQTQAYMFTLGPRSTVEVCEIEFIETQSEAFRKILSGDLVPLVPRKDLKEMLNKQQQPPNGS
jgi:hypothetical protein